MPREVPGSFGSIPLSWSEMRNTPVCSSPSCSCRNGYVYSGQASRAVDYNYAFGGLLLQGGFEKRPNSTGMPRRRKNNHKPRNKNVKANVERRCLRSAIDTTGHTVQTGKLVSTHWNTCKPAGCRLRK